MRALIIQLVLVVMVFTSSAVAADIILVVNKNNPNATLSKQEAKMIYLGKKKSWSNGEKINLYSQYDFQTRDSFARKWVNKSGQQFTTYWKKALFTGTGRPPVEVKNDDEMKKFIIADPKGIGFISSAALDGSVKAVQLQ